MTAKARQSGEQGFTLMEVLAAMLISLFGILTVANLFGLATHRISAGRDDTTAALYAQAKIEQLMLYPDDAIELDSGYYADLPDGKYRRFWWVYKNNPADGSRLIIVKVQPMYREAKPVVFASIRS